MERDRRRVVVITGGGTGMGRASAEMFAGAGDLVVIAGRREEPLRRAADEIGLDVRYRACDASDPVEVAPFVGWLTSEVSSVVDVLINNAGGTRSLPEGASLPEAASFALALLRNNLMGSYLMTFALRPHLRRPGGRVINISSIAAFRGGGDMYSAAKAGVVGLSYSLAQDLGPDGITVNVVAPGLVLGTEFFGDRMTDERRERTVSQTPMGRAGRPADIAAAVRYLASEDASFVTGEVLHVNGGWLFGR